MGFATGKHAKFISDRSGFAFPYSERVREWNGAIVHISEFEAKHPQLDPARDLSDNIALKDARTDRVEPSIQGGFDPVGFPTKDYLPSSTLEASGAIGTVTVTTSG